MLAEIGQGCPVTLPGLDGALDPLPHATVVRHFRFDADYCRMWMGGVCHIQRYVNGGDGTAVGTFIADAKACQDQCTAADACGFFNYDAENQVCHTFGVGDALPASPTWFVDARGFLTGGPDCAIEDALAAEAAALKGAAGCFTANAIYINAAFGTCGGSNDNAALSGSIFVASAITVKSPLPVCVCSGGHCNGGGGANACAVVDVRPTLMTPRINRLLLNEKHPWTGSRGFRDRGTPLPLKRSSLLLTARSNAPLKMGVISSTGLVKRARRHTNAG